MARFPGMDEESAEREAVDCPEAFSPLSCLGTVLRASHRTGALNSTPRCIPKRQMSWVIAFFIGPGNAGNAHFAASRRSSPQRHYLQFLGCSETGKQELQRARHFPLGSGLMIAEQLAMHSAQPLLFRSRDCGAVD